MQQYNRGTVGKFIFSNKTNNIISILNDKCLKENETNMKTKILETVLDEYDNSVTVFFS
jgi:hypothetical protein